MAGGFGIPRNTSRKESSQGFRQWVLSKDARYYPIWFVILALSVIASGVFGWNMGYRLNKSPEEIQLKTPGYTTHIDYEEYEFLKKTRIQEMCIQEDDAEIKYCFSLGTVKVILPNGPRGEYIRVLNDDAELIEVLTGEK